MAKGDFKCNSCGRTFAMAAHLARHESTMHKRRGRPKGSKNKATGGRVGRPPQSPVRSFAGPMGDDDSRILNEMQSYRDSLLLQRSQIEQRLDVLQNAMTAMGSGSIAGYSGRGPSRGSVSGGKRRGRPPGSKNRPRNSKSGGGAPGKGRRGRPGSLRQMIVQVLRQRSQPHSPQEITSAVMKAGYKTKSDNLTKSVSNTLPQLAEVRKVGRGLYQIS